MSDPPAATPRAKPPSNAGCVLAIVALPVVILLGIVLGTVLRGDDEEPSEAHVTLDEGTIDGTAWRVDAVRDVEGASCVFSFLDDVQSTGACTLDPQDETIGDQTVVFGRAASDATSVRVRLSDGEVAEVETTTASGIDGRFYVTVVDGDLDADGFATST
jgi:hypothetical protein